MAGVNVGAYNDVYQDLYTDDIVVAAVVTIPTPTITVSSTPPITVTPVAAVASIPTPIVPTTSTVSPAPVAAVAGIPAAVASGLITISARDQSRFYRVITNGTPRLVLPLGHNRSGTFGLDTAEGWERVSSRFVLNADNAGHAAAMLTVAAAWDANKSGPAATLLSAIDAALNSAGYRDALGNTL